MEEPEKQHAVCTPAPVRGGAVCACVCGHARACVCIYIWRIGKFTERCDQIRAEDHFHVSHGGVECLLREQHAEMLLM